MPAVDEDGNIFKFVDDSGLIIKTKKGLIVLSGCGHSGICNTIEYAKKITGENKILAAIGGFHLKEVDDCSLKTIDYMKANQVENVYLAHCVSDVVCDKFLTDLPMQTKVIKTGEVYIF